MEINDKMKDAQQTVKIYESLILRNPNGHHHKNTHVSYKQLLKEAQLRLELLLGSRNNLAL